MQKKAFLNLCVIYYDRAYYEKGRKTFGGLFFLCLKVAGYTYDKEGKGTLLKAIKCKVYTISS